MSGMQKIVAKKARHPQESRLKVERGSLQDHPSGIKKTLPDPKRKIIPDEEAAPIVRIFSLCMGGKGHVQICNQFKEEPPRSLHTFATRKTTSRLQNSILMIPAIGSRPLKPKFSKLRLISATLPILNTPLPVLQEQKACGTSQK